MKRLPGKRSHPYLALVYLAVACLLLGLEIRSAQWCEYNCSDYSPAIANVLAVLD